MSSAASHPHLRFVSAPENADHQARQAIIKENRIAAHAAGFANEIAPAIDPHDPRWILAMQTQSRLQGAILTPAKRDQLLKNGAKLGLRPFEANLVIAVVQDRARCGLPPKGAGPALSLVGARIEPAIKRNSSWPKWLLLLAASAAVAAILARWLVG